jgi:hypothetical protein
MKTKPYKLILVFAIILSVVLSANVAYAADVPNSTEVLSSNEYYTTYFKSANDGDYYLSTSDIVFSYNEAINLFNQNIDVRSDDTFLANIKNYLQMPSVSMKQLLLDRSGTVIRYENRIIDPSSGQVHFNSIKKEVFANKNLVICNMNVSFNDLNLPIDIYILIPKQSKSTVSDTGTVKDDDNKDKDKDKDKKVKVPEKDKIIVQEIYERKSVGTVTGKESIYQENKNLVEDDLNVIQSIKTLVPNISSSAEKMSDISDVPINIFRLDLNFVITHNYIISGSLGIFLIFASLIFVLSSIPILRWYKKREDDYIDKM